MSSQVEEPVRLPGMVNIEMEADKLDPDKLRNLQLDVPLQISVGDLGAGVELGKRRGAGWVSPSPKVNHGRSESVESRQRKRTRDWLEGKLGGQLGSAGQPPHRVRSASAGRDKRTEMAARYWAVLFENLRRAVDDLYRTCEGDESCIAAKEVVMVLENYTKDFSNLINWLRLKIEYENTPQPQRPTSLAWDIRKTSPLGRVTGSTTPGKLTPTRQLLLTSPAKRQLNFESESDCTRTRKVSETIKEVGPALEEESGLSPVHCSIKPVILENKENVVMDAHTFEEDRCSEHEKSDSEQEKDTPAIEEESVLSKSIDDEKAPDTILTDATDSLKTEEIAIKDEKVSTVKKGKSKSSKKLDQGSVRKTLVSKAPGDKASSAKNSFLEKVSSKVVIVDKVVVKAGTEKPTVIVEKVIVKPGAEKPTPIGGIKGEGKTTSTSNSKSTSSDKSSSHARREKSTEKAKPIAKQTTFASTVKTSLAKFSGTGAGVAKPSNPRMTRALTNLTPSSKARVPARKTAAGLLITANQDINSRNNSSSPSCSGNKTSSGPGKATGKSVPVSGNVGGSPKQQRISLVARQAKFAIENQNPNRKAPLQQTSTRSGKSSTPSQRAPLPSDMPKDPPLPHGSTTSLNSGSSGLSWADCVRGKTVDEADDGREAAGSAEDLSRHGTKGKTVDSDGWCTVRRARARVSPGSKGPNKNDSFSQGKMNHAKHRYRMPSSAMSMPSLAFEDIDVDQDAVEEGANSARPVLEKSSSSASILLVRSKGEASGLTKLAEKEDSSTESLCGDPSRVKKKKDQINHSKQKALKKFQDVDEHGKPKIEKSKSCPVEPIEEPTPDAEEKENESSVSSDDSVVTTKSVEVVTNIMDPEFEAIAEREKAIAQVEMEVNDLKREKIETEQSELTDTDCDRDTDTDNYTTDTDTADTRSEVGTGDISSRYEALLEGLSWAEQKDLEEQLEESNPFEARLPGRAIQLHEKLSSPARKREPHETFKHYQDKQDRARVRRLQFGEEKASKLTVLNMRIEEAMEQRDKLIGERKDMIDKKLRKAEEKRIQHIEGIRKKAHAEEEKLKEIAFINSLQEQNQRMDMLTQVEHADEKCAEILAEIAGERAKKAEQREEREAKAEERRRAMEEERQKQIDAMVERRREKEERIQEEQAAAREQRKVSAAIKDKTRLDRLSTVRAAENVMKEELQEKIQQKQEDAAKRHAEIMDNIRQKAWELSVQKCSSDEGVPLITPYEIPKKCEACKVLIKSEVHLLSHLRGKQHQAEISKNVTGSKELSDLEKTSFNLKHISDAPLGETDPLSLQDKERVKAAKKRAKKLKSKMSAKAADFESGQSSPNKHLDSPNRAKIGKSLREIEKLLSSQGKGAWPNNSVSSLERAFGEIIRSFDKNSAKDQDVFHALGGFDTMGKIYKMLGECRGESTCVIPIKSLVLAGKVMSKSTYKHPRNTEFLLMTNRLTLIADILLDRLARLAPVEGISGPDVDPLSSSIMSLLSATIEQLSHDRQQSQPLAGRLQDLVSYIVCSGSVDYLASYFQLVRDPIDSSPEVAEFLLTALQLLTSLTAAIEKGDTADPTHLLAALRGTELAGTVSMLYGMLLHQGRDSDRDSVPPELPDHTLAVVTETATLLLRLVQDQQRVGLLQAVLGQEGISLEFRHIASYLLYYCQHYSQAELLNNVILMVGYFTANQTENQAIVQSGSQPSVLQQLANLPFQYFSQTELKSVLFPTLLSSCHDNEENMDILTQEMSWQLIEEFISSEEGKANLLVQLVTKA